MRLLRCLLLVPVALVGTTACELDGQGRTPDTSVNGCESGWVQVDTAMVISSLQLNQVTLVAVHEPNKTYDDYGPSGCYNETTGLVRWIFEANGEPAGTFEMFLENPTPGNVDLQSYTDYFQFTFFPTGATATGSAYFTNYDWVTGTWVVDSTDPLTVAILGEANDGGAFMNVNMTVEVSLP